ncbi:hypothetical protein B0H14DRAFT_2788832 [Mycena olivaceomarginata]|nr:hypothetical protein B0H14DRAFT_2788832 [Mycena olivaceomarginata]
MYGLLGAFDVAIARDGASWLLVTPKGNGFLDNSATGAFKPLQPPPTADPSSSSSSVASRFCRFWFDSDWDRRPTPWSDLLAALLTIEPKAPVKLTGQTRRMVAELGGEREAVEVEVLLDESELCKVCYYCGEFESTRLGPEDAYRKIGGEGYTSTYSCHSCAGLPFVARSALRSKRKNEPPSVMNRVLQMFSWN